MDGWMDLMRKEVKKKGARGTGVHTIANWMVRCAVLQLAPGRSVPGDAIVAVRIVQRGQLNWRSRDAGQTRHTHAHSLTHTHWLISRSVTYTTPVSGWTADTHTIQAHKHTVRPHSDVLFLKSEYYICNQRWE